MIAVMVMLHIQDCQIGILVNQCPDLSVLASHTFLGRTADSTDRRTSWLGVGIGFEQLTNKTIDL